MDSSTITYDKVKSSCFLRTVRHYVYCLMFVILHCCIGKRLASNARMKRRRPEFAARWKQVMKSRQFLSRDETRPTQAEARHHGQWWAAFHLKTIITGEWLDDRAASRSTPCTMLTRTSDYVTDKLIILANSRLPAALVNVCTVSLIQITVACRHFKIEPRSSENWWERGWSLWWQCCRCDYVTTSSVVAEIAGAHWNVDCIGS